MPEKIAKIPGQVRVDIYTHELVIPSIAEIDRATSGKRTPMSIDLISSQITESLMEDLQRRENLNPTKDPMVKLRDLAKKEKPQGAAMSTELLRIIKERINRQRKKKDQPEVVLNDTEFAKKLIVFRVGTEIKTDPDDTETRINSSVVAWETNSMDNQDIPYGCKFYQLLGVFAEFKATGKVSTDKCTRSYATIQRSDCVHPENLRVSEFFYANPLDEIKVIKSRFEKTGFYYSKQR